MKRCNIHFNSHQHIYLIYGSKSLIKKRSKKNETTKTKNYKNVVHLQKEATTNQTSTLPDLIISSTEAKERINKLQKFVKTSMVCGVDYGSIDGFSKHTLLKLGAENLCDAFVFSKTVNVINRIEQ